MFITCHFLRNNLYSTLYTLQLTMVRPTPPMPIDFAPVYIETDVLPFEIDDEAFHAPFSDDCGCIRCHGENEYYPCASYGRTTCETFGFTKDSTCYCMHCAWYVEIPVPYREMTTHLSNREIGCDCEICIWDAKMSFSGRGFSHCICGSKSCTGKCFQF